MKMSCSLIMVWAVGFAMLGGMAVAAATEVRVGSKGELQVDGKPFLPIFAWAQPRELIAFNHDLGINAIVPGEKPEKEGPRRALLDDLHANGMYGLLDADDMSPDTIGHPALLAWRFGDEPDIMRKGEDGKFAPQHEPDHLVRRYREVRARDASRPVWINLTARFYDTYRGGNVLPLENYRRYGEACDIISYDHYPVTGWNKPERVPELYHATRVFIELYPGKAHWVIVENADQNLSWTPPGTRGPTPEETRAMVWMALVAGANGIGYFPVAFRPFRWQNLTEEMKAEMRRLNAEITALSQPLLVGEPIPAKSEDTNAAVRALRQSGADYLFVVNLTRENVLVAVALDGAASGMLYDRDGGPPIQRQDGRFSLKLGPLARGIFRDRPW